MRRGDEMIEVAVRDSGRGIAPEVRESLFDPFVTTKREGLGMGLSISRTIVELHGGKLWASAGEDAGATFHFILPVGEGAPDDAG